MNVIHLLVSAIAQITLDHPVNNRINFQMRQERLEAIEQVATSDARVLVIKAAGENFSLWWRRTRMARCFCGRTKAADRSVCQSRSSSTDISYI
jgi:enoyl-CoA hydratase/carnithine racemase